MRETILQNYENAQSKRCTVRHATVSIFIILACCFDLLNTYIYRYRTTFSFLKDNA